MLYLYICCALKSKMGQNPATSASWQDPENQILQKSCLCPQGMLPVQGIGFSWSECFGLFDSFFWGVWLVFSVFLWKSTPENSMLEPRTDFGSSQEEFNTSRVGINWEGFVNLNLLAKLAGKSHFPQAPLCPELEFGTAGWAVESSSAWIQQEALPWLLEDPDLPPGMGRLGILRIWWDPGGGFVFLCVFLFFPC